MEECSEHFFTCGIRCARERCALKCVFELRNAFADVTTLAPGRKAIQRGACPFERVHA
jgi:hypothetical protein